MAIYRKFCGKLQEKMSNKRGCLLFQAQMIHPIHSKDLNDGRKKLFKFYTKYRAFCKKSKILSDFIRFFVFNACKT